MNQRSHSFIANFLGRFDLKVKFVFLMVLMTVSVLLAGGMLTYRQDSKLHLGNLQNKLTVLAKVLGNNAAAALEFQNREDALEILRALSDEPSIRAAYLFEASGKVLAEYRLEGEPSYPPEAESKSARVDINPERLSIVQPISHDGKFIGTIYLSSNFQQLNAMKRFRLKFGAMIFAGVLIGTICLALIAQRYLVAPVVDLALLAERIGRQKEFSLRAQVHSKDELGMLAENFNSMLDELHDRERELKKNTMQLQTSNQQLEQFANIAAHDLQEPLRKVRAYADRLVTKCRTELSEQGKEYLASLDRSVARMQTLVSDLLEFSRVKTRAKPFSKTDLREVVNSVISDLQVRITETGGRVEVGDLPTIDADTIQIQQVLQNLIANGLKFYRKSEQPLIAVSSRILPAAPDGGRNETELCEIIVKDNGIGFDEKYLDRIFDPFQRLHNREDYEGTGMGLAICRRIIERHQGTITARSTPNQGSAFIVTLPTKQV